MDELNSIFKADQIKNDPDSLAYYGKDWTRYYSPNPSAIVFPKTTEEVQKLVQWARKTKTALVPSGGRTGLSGAAVAANKEVVVSFEKMNKILDFNPIDRTITCEAGVVTQEVQNFAKEKGVCFPVDFAARGTAVIGGNIATNAGGLNVIRYGLTRDWVAGLKVVTGRGDVLDLNNALVKNATGYDFRHLFIGSEGTLGFVTEVTVKVTNQPLAKTVLILGLHEVDHVLDVFIEYRKKLSLTAFEIFTNDCLKYVLEMQKDLGMPFASKTPYYLLVEAENPDENSLNSILSAFEWALEKGYVQDGVISQSETQAQNFWKYRDYIAESVSQYKPYKNDISVRVSQVTEFMKETDKILKKEYPGWEVCWFGHIGDGNLHISILKPSEMEVKDFVKNCQRVDQLLFASIKKFNGSISAEHGVGLSKKPFLNFTRSQVEIDLMKQVKKVFDPDLIMNPGKIFDSTI